MTFVQSADGSRKAEKKAVNHQRKAASRVRLLLGIAASVVLILALIGLLRPLGEPAAVGPIAVAQAVSEGVSAPAASSGDRRDPVLHDATIAVPAVYRHGDLGQALERHRAALADRPADPELLDGIGQVLIAMNRPAEAVPYLKQAVEAEPWSVTSRFDLAVALARSGQLQDAVDEYQALVESGSDGVRVYHNLGIALRQLGRHAEAAAAFERATSLAPEEAPAWLGLALSLEANGRAGDAAAALDRYLTLEPDAANADNVRARIARLRAVLEPSAPPPQDPGGNASRRCP